MKVVRYSHPQMRSFAYLYPNWFEKLKLNWLIFRGKSNLHKHSINSECFILRSEWKFRR